MKQPNHPTRFLALILALAILACPGALYAGTLDELRRELESTSIQGTATAAAGGDSLQLSVQKLTEAIDTLIKETELTGDQRKAVEQLLTEVTAEIIRLKASGREVVPTAPPTATTGGPGGADTTTAGGTPAAGDNATSSATGTPVSGTVNVDTRLNVRDGAWGNIIGKLNDGDAVQIIGQEGDWLRIRTAEGGTAFVHSRYVNQEGQSEVSFDGTVRTDGGTLNVRSTPGGAIIGSLNPSAAVRVTGRDGDWYRIDYNGQTAYVSKNYVSQEGDRFPTVGSDGPGGSSGNPGGTTAGGAPESGPAVDGFTFPVGRRGCRFTNTWGAPRSGGRRHEGQDIFNARGTPLVACKDGEIGRMTTGGLGGTSIRVLADGVSWYYTHLDRFANTRPGQPCRAGDLVGYLGNSGNARSTPHHLHFGAYRGGRAFDPYSLLHNSYPREWGSH